MNIFSSQAPLPSGIARRTSLSLLFLLLTGCSQHKAEPGYMPQIGAVPVVDKDVVQYALGVPPVTHAKLLWERYSPIVDEISKAGLGFRLRIESGQEENAYEAKLISRAFAFAILSPYEVLRAEPLGYEVIARTGAADRIRGLIVVRKDSAFKRIRDLKHQPIAFTTRNAMGATLLNRLFLFDSGFRVDQDIVSDYVRSEESCLMNVFLEHHSAAAVSNGGWDRFQVSHPEMAEELIPRWRTDDLTGPAVVCSKSVPVEHARALAKALVALRRTESGRAALKTAGFSEFRYGESASYDDVWEFLNAYRAAFKHLPTEADR